MKIAIIGLGNVGGALGRAWKAAGHDVVYGVRDPESEKSRQAAGGARLGTPQGAAAGAEVVLLAVPWSAVEATLGACANLDGKILLDATNPLAPDLSGLTLGTTTSGGERVQELARFAKVVKTFNTTGANNMAAPDYGGTPCTMLYAGDDARANGVAAELATAAGFAPQELGGLSFARVLEPMALAWIQLAIKKIGREFSFNIVKRPA